MKTFDPEEREEYYRQLYMKEKGHSFKLLIGFYKGNYKNLFLAVIFYLVKHSPVWVLPVVTAEIINIVSQKQTGQYNRIICYIIIMIILTCQNLLTSHLFVHYKSLAVRRVESGLRCALIHKLQHLSILYHRKMSEGRLQSKIMRDVEAVEQLSTQLFIHMTDIVISICIAMSVILFKNRQIFVLFVITVPLVSILVFMFRGRMRETNYEFRKEVENTSGRVMEMITLIPVSKSHALEEKETRRVSGYLKNVAETGYHLDIVQNLFGATGWVVFQVSQLICLGITSYLAIKGRIQIGDIVLYQTYYTTIVNQLTSIMNLVPILAKGFESINSVGEIMTAEEEDTFGKKRLDNIKGKYRFDNVCYRYPDSNHDVVKNLSFSVEPGETVAIIGESGAGKSTVLNLIIGFLKPVSGKIYLDGNDMNDLDICCVRQHMAVVPQETILFSGSIRENITYGMDNVSEEKIMQVIEDANLSSVIAELPDGIDTKILEHGSMLSGGQRQRLSIARAFLREPNIIILDEATSALDTISEKKVQEAFERLSKGRTTFIVSHHMDMIKKADKKIILSEGHCIE